jgi:hypothetical protein
VGDVGKKLTTCAIGGGKSSRTTLEVIGHAVERARQGTHLVAAALFRANVGPAVTERARGVLE